MARLQRISPVGVPVHLIQRGNDRHTYFCSLEDYSSYMVCLKEYSKKCTVDIHAWVLMTNHVHILYTPTMSSTAAESKVLTPKQTVSNSLTI